MPSAYIPKRQYYCFVTIICSGNTSISSRRNRRRRKSSLRSSNEGQVEFRKHNLVSEVRKRAERKGRRQKFVPLPPLIQSQSMQNTSPNTLAAGTVLQDVYDKRYCRE